LLLMDYIELELMVGPVLDVVCTKAGGMRGQAHVVFRDVATATIAMRALQNFMFLDKEMVLPIIHCFFLYCYCCCS
jgi:hypothetical protein